MDRKTIGSTIIFLCLTLTAILSFVLTKDLDYKSLSTDSGFDSSWDSGGSDFGGSSSYDSYSSSHDSSSSSSGSGSSYTPTETEELIGILLTYGFLIGFMILLAYLFMILLAYLLKKGNPTQDERYAIKELQKMSNQPLTDEEIALLAKYGCEKEKLLKDCYDVYVKIQEAWASNDIDEAKDVLSNDLYNTYKGEINVMKMRKQRNAMSDFHYCSGAIKSLIEDKGDTLNIKVFLNVTCKDYLINTLTNAVIRGNSSKINNYYYEMQFILSKSDDVLKNCPNCNAKIDEGSPSVTCEYCGSSIVKKSNKLVLTGKRMIVQR
jgi:DNA-directed RNA polymerase subunit RPC12/RpoP